MNRQMSWQRLTLPALFAASMALVVALSVPAAAEPGERTRVPSDSSAGRTRVERSPESSSRAERATGDAVSSSDRSASSDAQSSAESRSSARARTRVAGESRYGRGGSRHDGRHGYYYYPRYSYLGYYDRYFVWPWWWGGWYYEPHPYGYDRGYRYGYDEEDAGALDFDVSPERAEIYVDGKYIGVADDFDGFPSYLWLPKGTYDVAVYLPGFRTISRQYSVYPGVVIDVEDEMDEGESVKPEDLVSKSTVNKEERLRRDRERTEAAERREDRQDRERQRLPRAVEESEAEPGRLALKVTPEDASVYLDGRFLGTAGELARLHAGLIVDAGSHKLEVVRPGFDAETVKFDLEAGEETQISVTLSQGRDGDDENDGV